MDQRSDPRRRGRRARLLCGGVACRRKQTDDESRDAARVGLQKLPRNASPVRLRSRDAIDGRPRGMLSKFGISRVRFRDMAHRGELPGITKSSC